MNKRWQSKIVILLSLLLTIGSVLTARAQQQSSRYFPETGHTVRGAFLTFFDTRGGLEIFGYPITDEFVDPQTQLLVQYFQRARMEWHPDNPEPYQVQLGLLSQELGKAAPPLSANQIPAPNNPDCRYFPETGHSVCYSFLVFYDKKGGLDIFGYPITEIVLENNRFVQYFQRARMEWYPDRPAGQRVVLGHLGPAYFDFAGLDRSLLKPQPLTATDRQITSIRVSASVEKPITEQNDTQTVYVYVTDQQAQPVLGAQVTLVAHLPSGDQVFFLPPTNANGTTSHTFATGVTRAGQIILLDVTAQYATVAGGTRTSFLPWW